MVKTMPYVVVVKWWGLRKVVHKRPTQERCNVDDAKKKLSVMGLDPAWRKCRHCWPNG